MELGWDEAKQQQTPKHRGLDFADISNFDCDSILTSEDERQDYGEQRYNSTGYIDSTLCTFCWTPRNGKRRIISMRKINAREREVYIALKGIAFNP